MSIARALPGSLACANCRFRVLEAFTSLSGSSIAPLASSRDQRLQPFRQPRPLLQSQHGRPFTTSLRSRAENAPTGVWDSAPETEVLETPQETQEEAQPWYLQVQDEQELASPILQRQALPEIPDGAPECLETIIDRLSRTIGIDHLSLVDLRELWPPPALGNNLIMIIGTARSEKHLHTSADRLCRWLRQRYKLQPNADGLLGRNEMKLKLRRKARRAKLLGGRKQTRPLDDGISTGWVCVDIGPVGEGDASEAVLEGEAGGVSGFGQADERIRLVVQMMTEEKRAELELEDLWTGYIEQQRQRILRQDEKESALSEAAGEGAAFSDILPTRSKTQTRSPTGPPSQSRGFSTWAPRALPLQTARAGQDTGRAALDKDEGEHRPPTPDRHDSLQSCLQDLQGLAKPVALQALGRDWQDHSSTPFLGRFYSHIAMFPGENEWTARFQLLDFSRRLRHPGYTVDSMVALLRHMEESSLEIPEHVYLTVLRALESDRLAEPTEDEARGVTVSKQLDTVLEITENMTVRGLPVHSAPVLGALANELWRVALSTTPEVPSRLGPRAATEVALTAADHRTPLRHDELYIMAMQELASANDWPTLWRIWRSFPGRQLPRSKSLYAAMFRLTAASGHQARCVEALTTWVPEMQHERPAVPLEGRVALAVMAAIKVAEPQVDVKMREGVDGRNQWVRLFAHCYQRYS